MRKLIAAGVLAALGAGLFGGFARAESGAQAVAAAAETLPNEDDVHNDMIPELVPAEKMWVTEAPGFRLFLPPENLQAYAARQLQTGESGSDGKALVKAGVALQLADDPEKALAAYEKSLHFYPNHLDLYQRLATVAPKGITVYALGGKVGFTDVAPFVQNGRTLVPVRAITEATGATVEWDNETATATFTLGHREVSLTRGQAEARVGELFVAMDVPPEVVPPGRFVVPLRFISEAFGFDVKWHSVEPGHGVISIRQP